MTVSGMETNFKFPISAGTSAPASNDLLTAKPSLLGPHFLPALEGLPKTSLSKPFISETANWHSGDPATDTLCLALKESGLSFLFDLAANI